MAKTKELWFAVVGAGDFAVDKVRNVRKIADRKTGQKLYKDFVKRGRSLSTKVSNSTPGKQVRSQTQNARAQVSEVAKKASKTLGVNVQAWPKSSKSSSPKSTTAKSSSKKTTASAS